MRKARGFTLLEVLITLLVLSIGLLGIAALQITALGQAKQASLEFIAALQAEEMADRIRANAAGAALGAYNNLSGEGTESECISSNCSAAAVAAADLYEWNKNNKTLLPEGTGTVTGNSSNFTIQVEWTDKSGAKKQFIIPLNT